MSIKDLLAQYLNGQITSTEAIRNLSGIFNPDHAVDLLAIINQICRHEQGDLETSTFKSIYKIP